MTDRYRAMTPAPIYTPANCTPAYELRWSLAVFSHQAIPPTVQWLAPLRAAIEDDGVRILEYHAQSATVHQFLLSTKPHVTLPAVVRSVKARWQYLVRASHPHAFHRNFSLASIGHARREVVENYVATQLGHHRMADSRVQQRLDAFQTSDAAVDLSQPSFSSHGRYLYNVHLVLVHEGRWCEVREERLEVTRAMVSRVAEVKRHRLSHAAILADHLHLTLGCPIEQSPQEIALAYMNNLAYAHGMAPIFRYSYYVGTFGEYDTGAVAVNHRSTGIKPVVSRKGAGQTRL